MGPIAIKYLDMCYNDKNFRRYERDETFGITDKFTRKENGSSEGHLYIGNRHISIDGGKKQYKGTEGIWELLTKCEPENFYTEDLDIYQEIVESSNTHYRGNNPKNSLKRNGRRKYLGVIKKLLQKNEQSLADEVAQEATGKGSDNHRLWKVAHNYHYEYMYYHTPEQLKQQLKLLFGERIAVNNNPVITNEIANIRKELSTQKKVGRGFLNLKNWSSKSGEKISKRKMQKS